MKTSSFLAEEEIIFEQDEISIITELTLAGRIFAVTIILISIPLYLLIYLFFASVPFFVDVPYNYVLLAAFLFFIVYSVDYCVKNRHHFFYAKIKINKENSYLQIIDKLEKVVKEVDFGKFNYISLQNVSYNQSPFVSIVLIGDESKMSIKKSHLILHRLKPLNLRINGLFLYQSFWEYLLKMICKTNII